jgi:hypothetical protein
VRFDAENRVINIMPGNVSGGVSFFDRLFGAWVGPLDFHFDGQVDESGRWLFHGGHFNLHAPDIAIQGMVDELVIDPMGGFGTLNGSAADGSQGASPWMDHFFAQLSGQAEPGIPGMTYGTPAILLDTFVDLEQMSGGWTLSTPWVPVQVHFGSSLVEAEEHEHALPGDYNGDGEVNPFDYALWLSLFGEPGGAADGNGDGIVGAADYTVWLDNLGSHATVTGAGSLAANSASVPEPSAVALLFVAITALGPLYRRSLKQAK